MFLIPEAPSIQGNTLCGKGSDPSEGYNPTDPTPALPACAGCQGTPQQRAPYTSGGVEPGRQNTLNKREVWETRV